MKNKYYNIYEYFCNDDNVANTWKNFSEKFEFIKKFNQF